MNLDTNTLINLLSGKNRTFIKHITRYQEQKYNITNYFKLVHVGAERVEFRFEDHWIIFFFVRGEIVETLSDDLQHRYVAKLWLCAEELYKKLN